MFESCTLFNIQKKKKKGWSRMNHPLNEGLLVTEAGTGVAAFRWVLKFLTWVTKNPSVIQQNIYQPWNFYGFYKKRTWNKRLTEAMRIKNDDWKKHNNISKQRLLRLICKHFVHVHSLWSWLFFKRIQFSTFHNKSQRHKHWVYQREFKHYTERLLNNIC